MPDLDKLFDLSGRAALVTGGAGLLGRQFCKTLAKAGASVLIADVDEQSAKSLGDNLTKGGSQAFGVGVDVTQAASAELMVRKTLEAFGRLDILVNCAAVDPKFNRNQLANGRSGERVDEGSLPHTLTFEEYPLELWNQALEVNLTGMFLSCRAAVKPMLERGGGVIVNLCSIYGLVGPDQSIYQRTGRQPQYKPVDYSVTKAGVLGLTRYLAAYYSGRNIRVNALTPGGVFNDHDDVFVKAYSARAILGRMAEKDELNGALLFLVSDASTYMTGANLVVDGGWIAW